MWLLAISLDSFVNKAGCDVGTTARFTTLGLYYFKGNLENKTFEWFAQKVGGQMVEQGQAFLDNPCSPDLPI